jgi:hypothetical protein
LLIVKQNTLYSTDALAAIPMVKVAQCIMFRRCGLYAGVSCSAVGFSKRGRHYPQVHVFYWQVLVAVVETKFQWPPTVRPAQWPNRPKYTV